MADLYERAERLMGMTDEVWQRHASPWSVWTRFTCLPLLVLAIQSHVWLGWWCLPLIALSLFWIWYNPRAFAPPREITGWTGAGVLGERVWLRHRATVAAHHVRVANVLTWLSALGAMVLLWALWSAEFWATVAGLVGTILPKVWFVDRMGWIWADFQRSGGTIEELGAS